MDGLFEKFRSPCTRCGNAAGLRWRLRGSSRLWDGCNQLHPNSYEAQSKLFAQVQQVLPSEAGAGGAPDQQASAPPASRR
jgi:hypothetical protein